MIRRTGAQEWHNLHVTKKAKLEDLIDIDNSSPTGTRPAGFAILRSAAKDLNLLVQEAVLTKKGIRALGSGWALTDIAVPASWLLNTKLLNACFEVSTGYFESSYPEAKRPYVVIAQGGVSIGELNVYLEVTAPGGLRRSLKTAGIGAGQTIAGAVSGNTHGAAINFGAMPDFVVGIQLVTGGGKSVWIERSSYPVLNDSFVEALEASRIRDDEVFNAAVVSFGAFGIIAAVAIEVEPLFQLKFPPVKGIARRDLKEKLNDFDYDEPDGLYHYEFIFDPLSKTEIDLEVAATRVPYEDGQKPPVPVWIIRDEKGYAPGDQSASLLYGVALLAPVRLLVTGLTDVEFRQYKQRAILSDVRSTPGQLFTAAVTYLEGYAESAFGVSITDAARMMDISSRIVREMRLPTIVQARVVHPSQATLGFTSLTPKTVIVEFGLPNDARFPRFEETLIQALTRERISYRLHWSKNSGIGPDRLHAMYGDQRIQKWRAARKRVFDDDQSRMKVFENEHLRRAGLA